MRKSLTEFSHELISEPVLKARNIFSSHAIPLHGFRRAARVQTALKCDIDLHPGIHFMRDSGYHTPRHYYAAASIALEIGRFNELSHADLDLLVATALVHDYGYRFLALTPANGVSFFGARCMEDKHILFAKSNGVIELEDVSAMLALNGATQWARRSSPLTPLERCLSDADVLQSCLSAQNYAVETALLKREAAVTGMSVSDTFLRDVGSMESCVRNGVIHPFERARQNTISSMAGMS